jgi:hypothetical protein
MMACNCWVCIHEDVCHYYKKACDDDAPTRLDYCDGDFKRRDD